MSMYRGVEKMGMKTHGQWPPKAGDPPWKDEKPPGIKKCPKPPKEPKKPK